MQQIASNANSPPAKCLPVPYSSLGGLAVSCCTCLALLHCACVCILQSASVEGADGNCLGWTAITETCNAAVSLNALICVSDLQSASVDGPDGKCLGWAARDASGTLAPYKFDRRQLQPTDVMIKITHAGAGT
jgi:hypothetical protein